MRFGGIDDFSLVKVKLRRRESTAKLINFATEPQRREKTGCAGCTVEISSEDDFDCSNRTLKADGEVVRGS